MNRRPALLRWLALLALAVLAACTSTPPRTPGGTLVRPLARWVPVDWSELPGWSQDSPAQAWPALLRSCERPAPAWTTICTDARRRPPGDDVQARAWLMQRLRPYRVESLGGSTQGLMTGYYEPVVDARRAPDGVFSHPLYGVPADLGARRPYWTRRELETLPQAQAALYGRQIAYVSDPLDALILQIQGSGRLRIVERDGRVNLARVSYAGDNGQPYQSIGRWLVDQGQLPAGQASWPAIKDWARRNPARLNDLLWSNPRYVFFREEPLLDPALGPRGAQGVPLTPGRSIAVDPRSVPYGTPAWIETTDPMTQSPLRRLVVAQDTGRAIVGPVRADYFWGWEGAAADQAGRMRQPLRMWVLWPRN